MIEEKKELTMEDVSKRENTTAMAFIGDAVYELHIRDHVMKSGVVDADKLHRLAVRYVRAEAQAQVVRRLLKEEGSLSELELALVKRARNRRSTSKSRSAGPVSYKLATAFEALLGGLYMAGEKDRCREIMDFAVEVTEEKGR